MSKKNVRFTSFTLRYSAANAANFATPLHSIATKNTKEAIENICRQDRKQIRLPHALFHAQMIPRRYRKRILHV